MIAFPMAAFLNAITADIANRFVAFFMDKFSTVTSQTNEGKRLQHDLQRLLLRVRIIIEEAEGRCMTNKAMIYQLNILRKEMYRGYFTMDSLRIQGYKELKDHDVSHSSAPSEFNPAKRRFFCTGNKHMEKDTHQVLQNLNNIMVDMSEFVAILNNCPVLYRQPYSMHMYIGKCMFGRQMEMERVMDFLVQIEHPSMESLGVLPIVGTIFVGKTTLIGHVCNDSRVRRHFSRIVLVTEDETRDESVSTLNYGGVIVHQDNSNDQSERLLTIIEFSRNIDEVSWNSLYSSAKGCGASGSRMIITSRSNDIIKFGTTQPLVLSSLPLEAYWYLFKILVFGSIDSNDHPRLESIAMEMARWMNGSFIDAHIMSDFLRKNLDVQNWCMCLATVKKNIQRNIYLYGEDPYALAGKNKSISYQVDNNIVFYSQHRACRGKDSVPVITVHDLCGSAVKREGEFDVLLWKSNILPYKSYVASCMIEESS
ncbi:unnamed protein product [Urochloa decumbens]|uniref:NB-ARC domain-containing protein n=1 Tax=Urochloa decumbens TaxID=240449 RepID=A0ABC9B9I2_9POAL